MLLEKSGIALITNQEILNNKNDAIGFESRCQLLM